MRHGNGHRAASCLAIFGVWAPRPVVNFNTEATMYNDEAVYAQQMLSGLSDEPDQFRDPLAAFRALWAAQERALAGDDDGPMYWKF